MLLLPLIYLLHSYTPIFTSTLKAKTSDYVLFKLDIDSKKVEAAIVDYLLSDTNDDLDYIDEFLWEHHVDNYLMSTSWQGGHGYVQINSRFIRILLATAAARRARPLLGLK